MDESGFWQQNYDGHVLKDTHVSPVFESSDIRPFKKNRTYRSPSLHDQFLVAQSHLKKYKELSTECEQFINLPAFAKYIGILDVGNIHHANTWHNQRQYYNPVTAKLEPILYDCFQDKEYKPRKEIFLLQNDDLIERDNKLLNLGLMNSEKFRISYLSFIEKIASREYILSFESSIRKKREAIEDLLSYEYPFYKNDLEFFSNKVSIMSDSLDDLKDYIQHFDQVTFLEPTYAPYGKKSTLFRPDIALKAHTESKDSTTKVISLKSFHQAPIKVMGYSLDSLSDQVILLKSPISFSAFASSSVTKSIKLPLKAKFIYYAPENLNGELKRKRISKWPFPQDINVLGNDYVTLPADENGNIHLSESHYSFTKNVVILSGKKVIIDAGTTIDLINSAGFVSYIPVELNGAQDAPIQVTSSDSSASGFNVISDLGLSTFSYVNFNGLRSMNQNHWILTGAVTIYGHELEMNNCNFTNNLCEDALNTIRCSFTIKDCHISATTSDGFDADFCTGLLLNTHVSDTGNDAIDFSGCQITVENCQISRAGDKGISGGEDSQLKLLNTSVSKSVIGIAAKDFSQIEVHDLKLNDCDYGYAAFRKKPEYGPSTIMVFSSSEENIKSTMLLDKNSKIELNGTMHTGVTRVNLEELYSGF